MLISVSIVVSTFMAIEVSFTQTGDDIVIIINKSRPNLTSAQILMIFTGFRDRWPNGDKIHVLINKDTPLKERFCSQHLHTTLTKFYNFWQKKQSREGGALPQEFSSAKITVLVAGNSKYISFIKRSELTSSVKMANP